MEQDWQKDYTAEEIRMLQEDDDNSSHAEMIVKAAGAFSSSTNLNCSWAVSSIKEDYPLLVIFKRESDLDDLKTGRITLKNLLGDKPKPDPHKDPEAWAAFCNRINQTASRGQFMASIINVIMDHVPNKERGYAVMVDDRIPSNIDVLFCFKSTSLCDQIEEAHKMRNTVM
jgi:hypothetical protein